MTSRLESRGIRTVLARSALCSVLVLLGSRRTGTAASCTDAALDAVLAGGGSVTFDCGGPATIDISTGTGTKMIAADTIIAGGGLITISGGNSVGAFSVSSGVHFTVDNLTIANSLYCSDNGPGGAVFWFRIAESASF